MISIHNKMYYDRFHKFRLILIEGKHDHNAHNISN